MADTEKGAAGPSTPDEAVRAYYDVVWNTAFWLSDKSSTAADEIAQNVFLLLTERWGTVEIRNVGAWLVGATKKKYLEYRRSERRQRGVPEGSPDVSELTGADEPSTEDEYFVPSEEEIERLKAEIISELPEDDRILYERYFRDKMSYGELTMLYSISYTGVRSRVHRLRTRILRIIDGMKKKSGSDLGTLVVLAIIAAEIARI